MRSLLPVFLFKHLFHQLCDQLFFACALLCNLPLLAYVGVYNLLSLVYAVAYNLLSLAFAVLSNYVPASVTMSARSWQGF